VARKNEAKVIWQNIKSTLKAPKNIEEVMCGFRSLCLLAR